MGRSPMCSMSMKNMYHVPNDNSFCSMVGKAVFSTVSMSQPSNLWNEKSAYCLIGSFNKV